MCVLSIPNDSQKSDNFGFFGSDSWQLEIVAFRAAVGFFGIVDAHR